MSRILALAALSALVLSAAPALAQAPAAAPAPAVQTAAPDTLPLQYGRFTVEVRGHGPDLILIPGLASSRETWADLARAYEGKYRVHLIQIAGFAGTPAGANAEGDLVVAPFVEALHQYIQDKKLKGPIVIGHSLGGDAVLMLTARHPGDVKKGMAVDSLPFFAALYGPQVTPESIKPQAAMMRDGMMKSDAAGWSKASVGQIKAMITSPERQQQALGWMNASDRTVVAKAFYELQVTDLRPELSNITVPVTVVYAYGPHLPMKPEQLDAFDQAQYANLKTGTLVRVDDSRHFIMFDQPERFKAAVDAFLAK
jgi:pimeloyl-ACP methyl ester carboxylesterase